MLKRLEIAGFKSFARKTVLDFSLATTAIVGPNGSGKSNVAEAFRFALGEQSMKSLRGKRSEDLIFSGSHTAARTNRASVAIVFDNSQKQFKIDFDEVIIERAVFRDGVSEYSINGSKARLRDIQELLSTANIGETGHHIISQGEADRILLANPRERREMLEDALGLKAFEFKKQESERKLEKTQENIGQVESLRRELAPHVRFLSKQVEKLERADELRRELQQMCQTYFAIEETYLATEKQKNVAEKSATAERLALATVELEKFDETNTTDNEGLRRAQHVRDAERDLERVSNDRSQLSREIGKVEGALESAKVRSQRAAREPYSKVPREDLLALRDEIEKQAEHAGETIEGIRAAFSAVRALVRAFFERHAIPEDSYLQEEESIVYELENQLKALSLKDAAFAEEIEKGRLTLSRAREQVVAHEEANREGRHRLVELAQQKANEEAELVRLSARGRELLMLGEEFERDRAEALSIGGTAAVSYQAIGSIPDEDRRTQEDRKRGVERLKIRLEEAGGSGEDVRQEYKDATEREAFLAREIEDLTRSAIGLKTLIADLNEELTKTFAEGLSKVNASFGEFFSLMFGGGGAHLILEEVAQ
jgi:chromosome segregation protein